MGSPYDEAARELSQAVDHLRNARRVVETNLAKVFWFNIGNAVTQIELLGEELIRAEMDAQREASYDGNRKKV